MTFDYFNRRLHLYLALSLLPWFLVYGLSSIPLSHGAYFNRLYEDGQPMWTLRFERSYNVPVPDDAELKTIGRRIVRDTGLTGAWGAYRQSADELHVFVYRFRHSVRVIYRIPERKLRVEDARFRWDHFFTGMHARGGFDQDSWLDDFWAVVVDLFCVGLMLWVASGLWMWWRARGLRLWGAIALGAGCATFALFLAAL